MCQDFNQQICLYAAQMHTFIRARQEEEFKSYYQECLKATEKHGETRRNELNKLKIYNYILNQQYDKAHALADSTSILHERIAFQANIYAKEQKYKDAYQALQKLQSLQDSLNQLIQTADLSELNVRIGNEQLKRKAQALQLENTQLNLQKTTLELQQTKSQVEIEKMNAENNELLLKTVTWSSHNSKRKLNVHRVLW